MSILVAVYALSLRLFSFKTVGSYLFKLLFYEPSNCPTCLILTKVSVRQKELFKIMFLSCGILE